MTTTRRANSANGWLLAFAAAVLVACGGGGGSGSEPVTPDSRDRFPTVVTDRARQMPPAAETDDTRFFALRAGNRWVYERRDADGNLLGDVERTVLSGPDADGVVVVRTSADGATSQTRLRLTPTGLKNLDFLGDAAPARAQQIVGEITEFTLPALQNADRTESVRKGVWGEDLDGDRIYEGFDLLFSHQASTGPKVFPFGRFADAYSVFNHTLLQILPTRAGYSGSVIIVNETMEFVAGVGMVRYESATPAPGTPTGQAVVHLLLKTAQVDGQTWSRPVPDGEAMRFSGRHHDVTFDAARGRAIVAVPAGLGEPPGLLAVDAMTGAVSTLLNVPEEPVAVAVSADSSTLYVSLRNTQQLLRLRLPDLVETGRVTLPNGRYALQIHVSPTDARVVALAQAYQNPVPDSTMLMVSDMQFISSLGPEGLLNAAFGPDGTLFARRTGELHRFGTTPGGWAHTGEVYAGPLAAPGVVLGDRVFVPADTRLETFRASDLAPAGQLAGRFQLCVPAATQPKLVCLMREADLEGIEGLFAVVDAQTLTKEAEFVYSAGGGIDRSGIGTVKMLRAGPGQMLLSFRAERGGDADALLLFRNPALP